MSVSVLSPRLLSQITFITILIAILCKAHSTHAESAPQAKNNEGRYQIEMIIFNQRGYKEYVDGEFWRRDITLSYPQNYRQLTSTDTVDNTTTIPTDHPPNFHIMANSAHTLGDLRNSLRNNKKYRVLFHEAWQQQIAEKNTPAIIIQGGNSMGQHRELEGSIQLRVSRYLHIETNLWLIRFSATAHPESKTNSSDSTTNSTINHSMNNAVDDEWPILPMLPVNHKLPTDITKTIPPEDLSYNIPVVESITPLNAKRRMRSEELHYIDHPILGLLIIITPIEEITPVTAE